MWNGSAYARPDEEGNQSQIDAISALTSISHAAAGFPHHPPPPPPRYHPHPATPYGGMTAPYSIPMNDAYRDPNIYTNGSSYPEDRTSERVYGDPVTVTHPAHQPYPPAGAVSASSAPAHPHHHSSAAQISYAAYPQDDEERHFSDEDDEELEAPQTPAQDPTVKNETATATSVPIAVVERGKPMALQQAIVANDGEPPRGKPEAMARALALIEEKKKVNKKRAPRKRSTKKIKDDNDIRTEFSLGDEVPELTEDEYLNLEDLMTEFCKIPLLAEFSRPVAVLHPEISKTYNSIISQPVDLGHVCRGIRQRKYKNLRDVRLDLWLVFGNCVKYNSHSNNKDAVPSFVSIALHLREYLNNLWQEFMVPSDLILEGSPEAQAVAKAAFENRAKDRRRRVESSGVLIVSREYVGRIIHSMTSLLQNGGRVDRLDRSDVLDSTDEEIMEIIQRINEYKERLQEFLQSEESGDMQLEGLYDDLKRTCFGDDLTLASPNRAAIFGRLDRWFWKIATPLHEANCRGVAQSSIWGNIATCIWARESGKKPFWPALCLGILPPAEQREPWHDAVTERNECRLPEKLRMQLQAAKKRCEAAQKRQNLSYFLVEFLGTHEFIWIKESDIIEEFDPDNDPNKNAKTTKKGRPSRATAASVTDNKTYQKALQECVWANVEYENVLTDALKSGDGTQDDTSDDGMTCSFNALCEQDSDGVDGMPSSVYGFDDETMSETDVDDLNYILSHDGLIDPESLTRKGGKSKKKSSAPKKEESGGTQAKTKNREAFHELMNKKQQKEAEKRRKKRSREREKNLKAEEKKRRRRSGAEGVDYEDYDVNFDKRARATMITKAYLMRMKDGKCTKSLAFSGVSGTPIANVDSIGLVGMTLAFRAASGMLSFPDEGSETELKRCPWKAIDISKVKSTTERTPLLKKKLALMKKALERINSNTEKRRSRTAAFQGEHEASMLEVAVMDRAARQNPFKKKKKASSSSPKPKTVPKTAPPEDPEPSDNSVDMSSNGAPVSEAEAVVANDADDSSILGEDESAVEVQAMVLDD